MSFFTPRAISVTGARDDARNLTVHIAAVRDDERLSVIPFGVLHIGEGRIYTVAYINIMFIKVMTLVRTKSFENTISLL